MDCRTFSYVCQGNAQEHREDYRIDFDLCHPNFWKPFSLFEPSNKLHDAGMVLVQEASHEGHLPALAPLCKQEITLLIDTINHNGFEPGFE